MPAVPPLVTHIIPHLMDVLSISRELALIAWQRLKTLKFETKTLEALLSLMLSKCNICWIIDWIWMGFLSEVQFQSKFPSGFQFEFRYEFWFEFWSKYKLEFKFRFEFLSWVLKWVSIWITIRVLILLFELTILWSNQHDTYTNDKFLCYQQK